MTISRLLYRPDRSLAVFCVVGADDSISCIHCKTCDIKAPAQDINWQVRYRFLTYSI